MMTIFRICDRSSLNLLCFFNLSTRFLSYNDLFIPCVNIASASTSSNSRLVSFKIAGLNNVSVKVFHKHLSNTHTNFQHFYLNSLHL